MRLCSPAPLILGCAVLIVAVAGCRRAGSDGSRRSRDPGLRADEGPRGQTDRRLRPGAAAPTPSARRAAPPARPSRKDPMAEPPALRPKAPAPLTVTQAGTPPRLTLRYRFSNNERIVWRATMKQVTTVRQEPRCPADLGAKLRGVTVRTIPMGYGGDLTTVATRAPDGLYQLDTRFSGIDMTLPPDLDSQRKLLRTLLSNLSYTRRMSGRGQVTRFAFGKLTPKALLSLRERLQAPLSHLHPMLPASPVGAGAQWRQLRKHTLQQPGGRIDTVYQTRYQLTAIRAAGGKQVVDLKLSTRLTMSGKLMGHDFSGHGSGTARLTLDAVRGVIHASRGTLVVCSAVKGRTSTNRTIFSQDLKSTGVAPGTRPAPAMQPASGTRPAPAMGSAPAMRPAPTMRPGPARPPTPARRTTPPR